MDASGPSRSDLLAQYQAATDDEILGLLDQGPGEFTDLARHLLLDEARRRGLAAPGSFGYEHTEETAGSGPEAGGAIERLGSWLWSALAWYLIPLRAVGADRGFALTTLAAGVALVGMYGGLVAAGLMGVLFLWPVYFVVFGCHVGIHAWIANRRPSPDRRTTRAIIASHVAFLAALLLQSDPGEGPGWLVVSLFAARATGSQQARLDWSGAVYDGMLLILPILSYVVLSNVRPRVNPWDPSTVPPSGSMPPAAP